MAGSFFQGQSQLCFFTTSSRAVRCTPGPRDAASIPARPVRSCLPGKTGNAPGSAHVVSYRFSANTAQYL